MTTTLFFLVLAIVSRVDGKKLIQANKRTQKRISEKKSLIYIYDLMSVNRCKKNPRNVFLFFIKTRKNEKKIGRMKV
jgi:hypothetical protein